MRTPHDPRAAHLWSGLDRRQVLQLMAPGAMIGLFGGVVAGGMGAAGGLSLSLTLIAAVSLAVPLALGGAIFDLLLTMGRIPLGPLAPMAMYWVVAFPIARAVNAALVNVFAGEPVAVPNGWLDFMVYNMLLSVGFAIGFWWLHQNFAPRWWFRLRGRNAVAAYFINSQLQFLGWQGEQREAKRQQRKGKRAARANRSRVAGSPAGDARRDEGGDAPLA